MGLSQHTPNKLCQTYNPDIGSEGGVTTTFRDVFSVTRGHWGFMYLYELHRMITKLIAQLTE